MLKLDYIFHITSQKRHENDILCLKFYNKQPYIAFFAQTRTIRSARPFCSRLAI
uniref:Uncharacterized protein n=1 Tax=Neisseria meningitidis alpha275 TaxID=295996 RepID=C6SJP3_NEIME|nr:hypothetical protein predicted by Glimmer/Critica [Neisseria meningitidis alpha275]